MFPAGMTGERSWLGTERTVAVGEDAMKARRFISLVMSAVICVATAVCMMPKDVKAEDPYVKVGYEDVSTGYETEKELPDSSSGSGKVTYNNGTLTLNGVTVPKAGGSTPGIGVEPHIDLTVNIVGINKITGTGSGLYQGYGSAGDYSLTLTGDGTLNVKGTQDCGIVVRKDINIGGGTISVTGGFVGLSAWNSITITGGSLTAKGEYSYGINAGSAITITGGSVIAEATGDNGKAFNKQPSFGDSKWYKWRTSADGAFTDSQVAPYTWSASDKYVEIVPRDGSTGTTTASQSGTLCSHEYEWVEDVAATADSDAKLVYKCKKCGHIDMRMDEANSAYVEFLRESADKITKAGTNATVKIEAKNWTSFQRTVIDALSKRPDVTLVIEYTAADNSRHQITIPAGTDLTDFIDANGYTGFDFLVSKGLGTDYWAGRLNK